VKPVQKASPPGTLGFVDGLLQVIRRQLRRLRLPGHWVLATWIALPPAFAQEASGPASAEGDPQQVAAAAEDEAIAALIDRIGKVPLGNGKWGTPAEAEAAGLFAYRGRWLPKRLQKQLTAWEKLDEKSVSWNDAYDTKCAHYRIKTNVPRFIVELEIKPFLDALYTTYVKTFKEHFGLAAKAADNKLIHIHHGYAVYKEQTGKTRGTPGFIVGGSTLHVFYEDSDPGAFYGTTFHEGAHQFFHALLPGASLPHWLNEALASYFEGCRWSRSTNKLEVGFLPPDRLTFAKMQLVRHPDGTPEDMFMRYGQADYTALHYALGWSFVYFLTHTEGGKYRDGFGRFLREMNGSGIRPVGEVFAATVKADLAALSKGWRPFVRAMPHTREPKWALLRVGGLPAGVDLKSGDRVKSLGGVPVDGLHTFQRLWRHVITNGMTVPMVVVRAEGDEAAMDYATREITVTVTPELRSFVRGDGAQMREHALID
jgi:hypothetical protein